MGYNGISHTSRSFCQAKTFYFGSVFYLVQPFTTRCLDLLWFLTFKTDYVFLYHLFWNNVLTVLECVITVPEQQKRERAIWLTLLQYLNTVGPRIACKFVQKFLRAIRIRAVRDYYLLVSDPNEFKNRVISRNFTVKSHYLRNFSKHYIGILWYLYRKILQLWHIMHFYKD